MTRADRATPHAGRPAAARRAAGRRGVLPGFGLTMGFTLFYVSLLVLIPLSAVFLRTAEMSWDQFLSAVTDPRAMAAYRLTFGASFVAALVNLLFGFLVAWVLVRYSFPGRRIVDGLVDLPFALPTAVAGVALTAVYSGNGWLGRPLEAIGVKAAYSRTGIVIALTFIGLPFVVRSVQPVLQGLDAAMEEAAASLGAGRMIVFRRVILPSVAPAAVTGFTLAFARGVGEYGSVIFISGNMPMRTEIVPLLIVTKLEQYDYAGATALAVVMLGVSFAMILAINLLQGMARRRRWATR